MVAQAIQKHARLLIAVALAVVIGSCATALKKESELSQAPLELKQNIENLTTAKLSEFPKKAAEDGVKSTVIPNPTTPVTKKKKKSPQTAKVPIPTLPAAPPTPPAPVAPANSLVEWAPLAWPYGFGDEVTWGLRYGVIEGGTATLIVDEPQVLDGEPVLHYRGLVKSSKLLELFYKIDNQLDVWVRMRDHLPMREEIRQLESARWGRRVVVFDQNANKAKFYLNMTKKEGNKEEVLREDAVAPGAQEIFSALYFVRFIDLAHNKRVNFPIHDRWRNWNNELNYIGDETISIPAGEFETAHYKSLPRVQGVLAPQGDVDVWIWKNPSNLVLKFQAKIKIGSLTGEVKSIKNGRTIDFPPPLMKTPIYLTSQGELPQASN